MQSNYDIERLIAEKRREIMKEKISLGLSEPASESHLQENTEDKENESSIKKSVRVEESRVFGEHHANREEKEVEAKLEPIPPGLDRYIRRYLGLPVMLKAGEYSPNNPLVRAERAAGDALLGLGEYERRRNTLRKIRQQQYREYLDQQAKKKQEAKEQAERERREREEKERQKEEERERIRKELEDSEREQRRASVCYVTSGNSVNTFTHNKMRKRERMRKELEDSEREQRRASVCYVTSGNTVNTFTHNNKVDTGVQVGISRPLSVAVQTDDAELLALSQSSGRYQMTEAERELSPRTVQPRIDARRRSCPPHDERLLRKSCSERLMSDLRHSYMPSIFDAEAIHMRNVKAEKEAAERRQFYQQELKNQIQEQQRIREERKTREKMLEQAEMRRLEEQLRALRAAQERETGRQRDVSNTLKENTIDFDKKRSALQKEIDLEQQKLFRSFPRRSHTPPPRRETKLPPFPPPSRQKAPFSTNIPHNSIFSPHYDVDSYLRKNLNPRKESLLTPLETESEKNVIIEKALVHDRPKEKPRLDRPKYEPFLQRTDEIREDNPIPVLRHSPKPISDKENEVLSEGMKLVDDKWKVPVVQKNILKSLPNDDGKSVSILTQLGSIRRQLQLEQLKLDNMAPKGD